MEGTPHIVCISFGMPLTERLPGFSVGIVNAAVLAHHKDDEGHYDHEYVGVSCAHTQPVCGAARDGSCLAPAGPLRLAGPYVGVLPTVAREFSREFVRRMHVGCVDTRV